MYRAKCSCGVSMFVGKHGLTGTLRREPFQLIFGRAPETAMWNIVTHSKKRTPRPFLEELECLRTDGNGEVTADLVAPGSDSDPGEARAGLVTETMAW